jgi:hypothetical protein
LVRRRKINLTAYSRAGGRKMSENVNDCKYHIQFSGTRKHIYIHITPFCGVENVLEGLVYINLKSFFDVSYEDSCSEKKIFITLKVAAQLLKFRGPYRHGAYILMLAGRFSFMLY